MLGTLCLQIPSFHTVTPYTCFNKNNLIQGIIVMRIIDCWCFQWKRHWICYKLLLNLLQVGVHVIKMVTSHSWPCYICFKWSCCIMFLSLKFVILNICWFKKWIFLCGAWYCGGPWNSRRGNVTCFMAVLYYSCQNLNCGLFNCNCIYYWVYICSLQRVVKLPKVLCRYLMMFVLFVEGSCRGWKASNFSGNHFV